MYFHTRRRGVHIEQILEYNNDPAYFAKLLMYRLSVEAQQRIEKSALSRRQIAKRLSTSVPQLYRLLDSSNSRKSIRQLIASLNQNSPPSGSFHIGKHCQ